MNCPHVGECSFKECEFAFLDKIIKVNYCNSSYEKCHRKALRDAGEAIPETLLPNGEHYKARTGSN